jgi:hypothetical protein
MEFYSIKGDFFVMSYLFIKSDDFKTFKSFLSGNEIEVGVFVGSKNSEFDAGKEIEIFYGEENTSTYRAKISKLLSNTPAGKSGKNLLKMCLARI